MNGMATFLTKGYNEGYNAHTTGGGGGMLDHPTPGSLIVGFEGSVSSTLNPRTWDWPGSGFRVSWLASFGPRSPVVGNEIARCLTFRNLGVRCRGAPQAPST